jgi:hypothetical protein
MASCAILGHKDKTMTRDELNLVRNSAECCITGLTSIAICCNREPFDEQMLAKTCVAMCQRLELISKTISDQDLMQGYEDQEFKDIKKLQALTASVLEILVKNREME